MSLQFSIDPIGSAWQISSGALRLIQAASAEEVSPSAILAMEQLGSIMPQVELSLIPYVREAFNSKRGKKEKILGQVQVFFGTSSRLAEVQNSHHTMVAFLLITAARASAMHAPQIGSFLVELFNLSGIMKDAVISHNQCRKLVEALLPYSQIFCEMNHMPVDPIVELLTLGSGKHGSQVEHLCGSLDHRELALTLFEVFNAVRQEGVDFVEVTGNQGAKTVVGILTWLYPKQTRVFSVYDEVLEKRNRDAKINIIIDSDRREQWTVRAFDSLQEPSTLFNPNAGSSKLDAENENAKFYEYDRGTLTALVPHPLLYEIWQRGYHGAPNGLPLAANLALGFVRAVQENSSLHLSESYNIIGKRSVKFQKICSRFFDENIKRFPVLLGCPETSIDSALFYALGKYFSQEGFIISRADINNDISTRLVDFDRDQWAGALRTDSLSRNALDTTWNFAMQVAELALLSATQGGNQGSSMALPPLTGIFESFPKHTVLCQLLGPQRSINASEYLQRALMNAQGMSSNRILPHSAVAISGQGRVSYLRPLITPPGWPEEAFEIVTAPGTIKWRNSSIRYLYDYEARTMPRIDPNPQLFIVDEAFSTKSKDLIDNSPSFKYHVTEGEDVSCAHLACTRQGHDGNHTSSQFSLALVNFALVQRATPSGRSDRELLDILHQAEADRLFVEGHGRAGLHCQPEFPRRIRAVAAYNMKEEYRFLQFGTVDAVYLHCLLQGQASLLDCIVQALEEYGSGWIVWAYP